MKTPVCIVHRMGVVPYQTAWRWQDRFAAEIALGQRPPTLLLLQHPHTFTFGRRGHQEHLLWNEEQCRQRGVEVHWVDRGGDVTYHGPGQLVGYPLLPLGGGAIGMDPELGRPRLPQTDYVGYLRNLERTLIDALAHLGVSGAQQVSGLTGVWVQPKVQGPDLPAKIASIGVKVDARGVSRHGFALNVNPEMTYWDGIIGCGLDGYPMASLATLLHPLPPMAAVMDAVTAAFENTFGYEIAPKAMITG
jgi:lipoate-protein ligase B